MIAATHWVSIFTAISAGAAAIAAIAACAAVVLEHRARQREREPLLTIGVSGILDEGGRERITVENSGGGLAREVSFLVVAGTGCCMGGLPPTGTLGPGKRVVLDAAYPPSAAREVVAAVMCRYGPYMMAWDAAGRHERVHLNRIHRPVSNADLFRRFYPDAPDTDQLHPYRYKLMDELST